MACTVLIPLTTKDIRILLRGTPFIPSKASISFTSALHFTQAATTYNSFKLT